MEFVRLAILLIVRNVWMEIHLNVKYVLTHTCWMIVTCVSVLKEIESILKENAYLVLIIV